MVGKTPQVREIVYNVLDDNGDRTVVAKGATTVDVGDTKELFTRTTALESLTSDNVSNISDVQSNITQLQNLIGGAVLDVEIVNIFSPLLLSLDRDHVSNVTRITTLEDVQVSNSLIISNNYSNISFLQDDFYSNIGRIDILEVIHESNVANINGNFSNISILQSETAENFSNISNLFGTIESITDFGNITDLQSNVEILKNRINDPGGIIKIGFDAGANDPGGASISIGQGAGQYIGTNSIAIGAAAQPNTSLEQAASTQGSIVINAKGTPLLAPRQSTLVIRPIQTDDSNTINIMGYNETYGEIVQSTLLRGIDGNVHATSNIIVNDGAIIFETNGNGSFGGIVEINSTLEVGWTSSFTGAMQMESTLEVGATSLFVGEMTVHDSVNVHGQSFIVYKGAADKKIILTNEGTGSFLTNVDIGQALKVGGTSSFNGLMQMENNLEVGGTSSFGGNITVDANTFIHGQSFIMYDAEEVSKIAITHAGNASFAGFLEVADVNCNDTIDCFNSFRMRDGATSNVNINKLGESSFAGKMQINNALVVQENSSFVGGIIVPSPATSSFGGAVTVNSTSTFTNDITVNAKTFIHGQSFIMYDAEGVSNISLTHTGNASFAGFLDVSNVNCDDTFDCFNTFRMRDGAATKVSINKDGESSFAGKMQINDTLNVGSFLTIQNAAVTDGKVIINPSVDGTDCVTIEGGLSILNGLGGMKASISRGGAGFFASALGTNGTLSAKSDFTIKKITLGQLDTDVATIQASTGNASFLGTMQVAGKIIAATTTSSFASGMMVGGLSSVTSITTGGKITAGGNITGGDVSGANGTFSGKIIASTTTSSFASGMMVGGLSSVTSITTGGKITAGGNITGGDVSGANGTFSGKIIASTTTSSFASGMMVGGLSTVTSITTGGKITAGGNITGLDFIIPSDRRFKTEITHIPNALDKIKQISGCTYKVGDKPSAGVIAQEILKVLPEVVHTREDGYYAVSYHGLIGLLIEAVKELSEKVK